MGSKSLPRAVHEGEDCIVLHQGQPLRQVDLLWGPSRVILRKIAEKYNEYLGFAQAWFTMDTGEVLYLFEDGSETVWAVRDTSDNSAKYRALQKKAERFEAKIVLRMNEYSQTLRVAYGEPEN